MTNYTKILIFVLLGIFLVGSVYLFMKNGAESEITNLAGNGQLRTIQIPLGNDSLISLSVPHRWNYYYNGNSTSLDIENIVLDIRNSVASIASEDRPVTLTDINWQQLDFYIIDGDMLGNDYEARVESSSAEKIKYIELADFKGYSSTEILPAGATPSKDNPGGTVYYLRPQDNNPTWNLVINKQAKGSEEFEQAVERIITSLTLTNNSATSTVRYFRDTDNHYQFVIPSDFVALSSEAAQNNSFEANSEVEQFTLEQYPFTSPEGSPFLQFRVFENPALVTAQEYFSQNLKDVYTANFVTDEVNGSNQLWYQVCTAESVPTHCGGYLKLPSGSILEVSYDVQTESTAATSFSSVYEELLQNFQLL